MARNVAQRKLDHINFDNPNHRAHRCMSAQNENSANTVYYTGNVCSGFNKSTSFRSGPYTADFKTI